jgi:AcrR family transcriptional regulator
VSIDEPRTLTRRQELLAIAADQFAAFGFHNVTVDDIGRAAGISGPALYHHFSGKEALLGEMLVSISQQLLDGGRRLAAGQPPDLLERLILFHCQFAVDNRSLITVHFRDLIHASIADRRRVRRLQATYALLWTNTVVATNLGVDERTARAAVHATFGLINSTPFSSTLPRAAMIDLLSAMSSSALGGIALGRSRSTTGSARVRVL